MVVQGGLISHAIGLFMVSVSSQVGIRHDQPLQCYGGGNGRMRGLVGDMWILTLSSLMCVFLQPWVLGLAALPKVIGSIKLPGLQAIMTLEVASSQQGLLQGSISSLRTLAKVRPPVITSVHPLSTTITVHPTNTTLNIFPVAIPPTDDSCLCFSTSVITPFIAIGPRRACVW